MKSIWIYCLTLWAAVTATSAAERPNVLIIFADDVGWGDIRCYNNVQGAIMKTPNIDQLAQDGMRFTDAHSRSLCAPSRYSVLTGNYPIRTKKLGWTIHSASSVQPGQKTMAEMFNEIGYHTAFFGKWHMGGQLHNKQGQVIPPAYETDWKKVDWTKPMHRGPTKLGFDYSYLTHSGIQHGPYFYLENDVMVGDPKRIMTWKKGFHDNKDNPHQTQILATYYGLPEWDSTKAGEIFTTKALEFIDRHVAEKTDEPFFMHFCTQTIHTPLTPGDIFGKKVVGETGHAYTDFLYEMDIQVGILLDHLKQHNLLENTLVVFTSDNGSWEPITPESYRSNAQWRGKKGEAHEAGHRVPFIIRWDGNIKPGTVCEQTIDQVDLLPSFAAMFGGTLEADDALDGLNISPYFFGDESRILRDVVFARGRAYDVTVDFNDVEFSYRKEHFKIISANQNGKPGEVLEMYQLKNDPAENTNLVDNPEYKKIKARLIEEQNLLLQSPRSTPAFSN
jgi:arylsulfatase A-like enzyme